MFKKQINLKRENVFDLCHNDYFLVPGLLRLSQKSSHDSKREGGTTTKTTIAVICQDYSLSLVIIMFVLESCFHFFTGLCP